MWKILPHNTLYLYRGGATPRPHILRPPAPRPVLFTSPAAPPAGSCGAFPFPRITRNTPMPKLLKRARTLSCLRRHSRRTESAYVFWIKRFIHCHGLRHPSELGHEEVTAYLSYLASDRRVSASTQNQAL